MFTEGNLLIPLFFWTDHGINLQPLRHWNAISIHDGLGNQIRRLLQLSSSEGLWWCWRSTGIRMDSCCTYKSSAAHVSVEYSMHLLVDKPRLNDSHIARLKGSMELSIMSIAYLELLSCSIFPQAANFHGIIRRWIVMESSFWVDFFMENNTRETKGLTHIISELAHQ